MPDHAALVTALILDRPTCIRCVATKSRMSLTDLDKTIATIGTVLVLHRATGRCRIRGVTDTVLFIDRPSSPSSWIRRRGAVDAAAIS